MPVGLPMGYLLSFACSLPQQDSHFSLQSFSELNVKVHYFFPKPKVQVFWLSSGFYLLFIFSVRWLSMPLNSLWAIHKSGDFVSDSWRCRKVLYVTNFESCNLPFLSLLKVIRIFISFVHFGKTCKKKYNFNHLSAQFDGINCTDMFV
jgi:hypothetical protein